MKGINVGVITTMFVITVCMVISMVGACMRGFEFYFRDITVVLIWLISTILTGYHFRKRK